MMRDAFKKTWTLLGEASASFRKNNDLSSASALAFSFMLAIIPALFLLTSLIGIAIGSSQEALRKVQEMLIQLIPGYSESILREVRYIAAHKKAFGALNGVILLLAVTPLVSDMRTAIGEVFRSQQERPYLLEKLIDLAITVLFLLGIAGIAVLGVALTFADRWFPLPEVPGYLHIAVQFLLVAGTVFLLYYAFSRRSRLLHLLAGAFVGASLWFVMRPLFNLFLAYNPGFGFTFGSFKSLFVVLIWIYYSLAVFLFGAEIAANLGRKEAIFLRKLMEGKGGIPSSFKGKYVVRYEKGSTIFREGDAGEEMYTVRKGSVGIQKDGSQVAVIETGKSFGEISFLLASPRIATAVALEDVELVIINNENVKKLMNEYPAFVVEMLRGLALRLRQANRLMD
jgi:membrane protein